MVNPTILETTIARYAIPANCSSITNTRAGGVTGTMSLNPVAERFVKLKKSRFKKVCGSCHSFAVNIRDNSLSLRGKISKNEARSNGSIA